MATVVEEKGAAVAPGENDLQVLNPERTATIAGRSITMREYGFVEGLKVRALSKPILDDLYNFVSNGTVPGIDDIQGILAKHADNVAQLIAQAADVEPEFIIGLDQYQGDQMLAMWWGCNGPFFMRKVIDKVRQGLLEKAVRAGLMSIPNSSPTGTTQIESPDTQSDK